MLQFKRSGSLVGWTGQGPPPVPSKPELIKNLNTKKRQDELEQRHQELLARQRQLQVTRPPVTVKWGFWSVVTQDERHWKRQQAVNMVYGVSLCLAPTVNRFVTTNILFLSSEQLVAKKVLSVHLLPLNLMATSLFF